MIQLWLVSFIWAFSFGLVKGNLAGIDPGLISLIRLGLAALFFLPFARKGLLGNSDKIKFGLIGGVQFGLMYVCYTASFRFLQAWQIALFTIFTPIYVTLANDFFQRKFNVGVFLAALISIFGTLVVNYKTGESDSFWRGFFLLQISNLCFAFGQVMFKKALKKLFLNPIRTMWHQYLGATIVAGLFSLTSLKAGLPSFAAKQVWTLFYLGSISSGLCFYLWNLGASKTKIGYLAVMNNVKIPLAVACSLLFFEESADLVRLFAGFSIFLFALYVLKFLENHDLSELIALRFRFDKES